MAKGDTTITRLDPVHAAYGGVKRGVFKAVLDNYKTGGYTFALTAFNMGTIKNVQVPAFLSGYALEYVPATAKLKVYTSPSVAGVSASALSLTTTVTPTVSATVPERIVIGFTKDVAISQSDVEVYQFTAGEALTVVSAKAYCSAKASTGGTVDIKKGGASVLSAALNPTAAADSDFTLAGATTLAISDVLTVHVTTDGSSTFTDLTVEIVLERTATASVTASATGTTTGNAVTSVPAVSAGPLIELTDNSAVLNAQIVYFEAIGLGV